MFTRNLKSTDTLRTHIEGAWKWGVYGNRALQNRWRGPDKIKIWGKCKLTKKRNIPDTFKVNKGNKCQLGDCYVKYIFIFTVKGLGPNHKTDVRL